MTVSPCLSCRRIYNWAGATEPLRPALASQLYGLGVGA